MAGAGFYTCCKRPQPITLSISMNTLREALARNTVDELKALTALLPGLAPVGRKDELIDALLGQLDGMALRSVWDKLDPLQRLAVAESLYTPGGQLDSRQFRAKYGALPSFRVTGDDKRRPSASRPTALCLFLHWDMRVYNLPPELGQRLRSFVPQPAAASLPVLPALPASIGDSPLTVRCTEREALVDLPVLLRLVDQGKLQVSDKTSQASGSTLRLLANTLSGGDFYSTDMAAALPGQDIGAIKAFAWPLLLQCAGLMQRNGSKSALSPAGRKALTAAPAELLRTAWQKWLKGGLLDEFSRIDIIKGQKSKGRVMTAVAPRREVIADALQDCPLGEWVAVDDFCRYMQAADFGFEVAHDPWKLYLVDPQYGSLGYDGSHTWRLLQLRYLLCLLFEYAAVLGIVDVAFAPPDQVPGRQDLGDLWGADDLAFLSRYDGLVYFRLTALGAFCLGQSPSYSPAPAQQAPSASLVVQPDLTVQVVRGPLAAEEQGVMETWAHPVGGAAWLLDPQMALTAVERGRDANALGDFLRQRADQAALPEPVEAFIRAAQKRGTALRTLGPALLIECIDADIAARVAAHPATASLCALAGERRLVVRTEHEARFRAALRVLGFGWVA